MYRLFTVRWPIFARLEALLLFATILLICNELPAPHAVLDKVLAAEAIRAGIPTPLLIWGALGGLLTGPYLGLLLAADRLLCVRNGFALLSVLAVSAWAGVAAILSPALATRLPAGWTGGTAHISFTGEAAIAAASLTLLVHARPLWIGLNDSGLVGAGLLAATGSNPWQVAGPNGATAGVSARSLVVPAIGLSVVFALMAAEWLDRGRTAAEPVGQDGNLQHLPRVVIRGGEATAWRRRDGSFGVEAIVNDRRMPMMFDTGASFVALRAEDAGLLGMATYSLDFSLKVRTANGITSVAPVTIDTLTVGSITLNDVRAVVAQPGALSESLLGQSFLGRLRDYNVNSDSVTFRGQ
jgi:aspartyl protease family protein